MAKDSGPHRVVVLGAGFGGLEFVTRLDELVGSAARITLIDRAPGFVLGFSKFDILLGRRARADVTRPYTGFRAGVDFRRETVLEIDPERRRVRTDAGQHHADTLVVALGADADASLTPGLPDAGHEFYTVDGAERLGQALPAIRSGIVLIAILGTPYKCPPAPFELAFQLHDHFTALGCREAVTIQVATPGAAPLPLSSEGSASILQRFGDRGIEFLPAHQVVALDLTGRVARLRDRDPIAVDHFFGVPRHRVPPVVATAGLAPDGWISVNRLTLETRFPGVFAVGDVTTVPAGDAAIPKAGAFADAAGRAAADEVARRITGSGDGGRFAPSGTCFLEFGAGAVAGLNADYTGPAPVVRFDGPNDELRAAKDAFGTSRLGRWFAD
jgi:sulfide:quinone oxidoreductase